LLAAGKLFLLFLIICIWGKKSSIDFNKNNQEVSAFCEMGRFAINLNIFADVEVLDIHFKNMI
jgi:hypothetical protein